MTTRGDATVAALLCIATEGRPAVADQGQWAGAGRAAEAA